MVWGLPLAGIFANKRVQQKLAPFGYYECVNTPGLWYHESRPITFTLVVDNFKVKFVKKEDVDHLIVSLKTTYTLTEDWTSTLYCGITLEWDYTLTALLIFLCQDTSRKKYKSMSMLFPKKHNIVRTHQNQNNMAVRSKGLSLAIRPPSLMIKVKKRVQKIVGSILYYAVRSIWRF